MNNNKYYYGCVLEKRMSNSKTHEWNCEMFDSFQEATSYVNLKTILCKEPNGPVGHVVSFSSAWPGFIRRQLLYFDLSTVFSIQHKKNF